MDLENSPIVKLEDLAGRVQFPGFCRRQVGIFFVMFEEVVGRDPTGETQSCNIRVKELKVEEEKTGKPTQVAPGPKSGTLLVDQFHDQVVDKVDYHVHHE